MPILRHAPGEIVSIAGTYALVGHYGEPTNITVRCEIGDRLPFVTSAVGFGPLWFHRVDEANEGSRAA